MTTETPLPEGGEAPLQPASADVASPPPPGPPAIAGFWRRLAAFIVDGLLIGLLGAGLGLLIGDMLAAMDGYARFVGFAMALAYGGLLNSRLTGGRTPGKYLLGIRVAGLDGGALSVPRTLARQVVFSVPFFLNGAPFSPDFLLSLGGALLSVVLFGGLFAIIYLFVFNRKSRQSLHDLAVGSCVLRSGPSSGPPAVPVVWRGHLVVVAIVCVLAGLLPLLANRLAKTEVFAELIAVQQALEERPGVLRATAMRGVRFKPGADNQTYVSVTLVLDNPGVTSQSSATDAARLVLATYPEAAQLDAINVTFVYGYDMVIASKWRTHGYAFRPGDLD